MNVVSRKLEDWLLDKGYTVMQGHPWYTLMGVILYIDRIREARSKQATNSKLTANNGKTTRL